jgi:putative DNA primase/helicase
VDTIADIMADYGTTIPIETLTGSEQRKGSDATPDLVRLPGARFVRASEPEQGQRMKEALIKALTGGEAIMIRRMHAEFVEIVPEFKLTISGNHKPDIRGADDGIWRRVMLVPWPEQITDEEVDRDLAKKLRAERDGILAWMVQGCLKYLAEGLHEPDVVKEATAEYRSQSDPLREFLTSECQVTESRKDFVSGRQLRDAFIAWHLHRGEKPWGSRQIALGIKGRMGIIRGAHGGSYEQGKSNGDSGYRKLMLQPKALQTLAEYRDKIDLLLARAR